MDNEEFIVQRRIFAYQVGLVKAKNHAEAIKKARNMNISEIRIIRPHHAE